MYLKNPFEETHWVVHTRININKWINGCLKSAAYKQNTENLIQKISYRKFYTQKCFILHVFINL